MTIATRIIEIAKSERCHIHPDGTILFPDALGRTALAITIEDEFGLPDLPEDEVERCCSVSDWVALVGKIQNG